MYIPKHFQLDDRQEAVAFMQRYSFATLITANNNYPQATHMPFLVKQQDDELILSSHFARANAQAADIEKATALVIFTEPHAYISPVNYEKEQNVPTWNYIAIHAYGQAKIVHDTDKQLQVLDKMVAFYDIAYARQWEKLPMDYKLKMIKGIIAFDIVVTDLQAKKKLSQNRTETERNNIIKSLSDSPHNTEKEIAEYMKTAR
ncbi:FMN-binding negative transcriptional regulator [Mucilaginibacter mali]|uniref:FMN-binding negative transcriptional regulator n=1 Tax=Mucilaginibacter mali TaxID=2740462 RepID=A0A7D4Q0R6_9SPHI|nr:FMN-binding negative transcriptional regulator [Mucilaginibacter mali]QKJ29986.1 FMN-binding negative transcriptional regulator [Mucilaginibacter mali]